MLIQVSMWCNNCDAKWIEDMEEDTYLEGVNEGVIVEGRLPTAESLCYRCILEFEKERTHKGE